MRRADGAVPKIAAERRLRPLPARGHLRRSETARPPAPPSTPAGTRPPSEADSPEILDVALDKRQLQAGRDGQAPHRHQARRQGAHRRARQRPALAAGGRRPQRRRRSADVTVGDDWGAGAYVTAMLYRPMDEKPEAHAEPRHRRAVAGPRPVRADAECRARHAGEDQVRRRRSPCRSRSAASRPARRRASPLAAVDLGILNLTRYPDAGAGEAGSTRSAASGLEIRDFYGRLIDGMRAERGTLRSGGDGGAGRWPAEAARRSKRRSRSTPASSPSAPTAPPRSTSTLPDFNGTVRVMAVAWTKTSSATVSSDVIVRDAVALTASRSALPDARRRGPPRPRRAQRRRPAGRLQRRRAGHRRRRAAVHDARASTCKARRAPSRAHPRQADRRRPASTTTSASPAPTASTSSAT